MSNDSGPDQQIDEIARRMIHLVRSMRQSAMDGSVYHRHHYKEAERIFQMFPPEERGEAVAQPASATPSNLLP